MADGALSVRYQASRTGARLHASDAFVRAIMGPIGSGKSVTCLMDLFARGLRQRPGPDGYRRTRWGVIRQTYPELKSTTIKTFNAWLGAIADFRWDSPITARITLPAEKVDMEFVFLAVERPDDVKKLLSLELTGGFINEAREVPKAVLDALTGRVGRYPATKDGGPTWSGVILDTNPPDTDHWWYNLAEEAVPHGWQFFRQPPAMHKVGTVYVPNPAAENIANLPGGYEYYLRLIPGKTAEWIKVYVLGDYGSSFDGKPIYPEYQDSIHCADDIIEPLRGLPLYLGHDYGRTPACAIMQLTPHGQLRIIDELVVDATGDGAGLRSFTRNVVKPHLATAYADMQIISRGDPSGAAKDGNDLDCFTIQAEEGVPTQAATSNDPEARRDALRKYMLASNRDEPGLLVSPKAHMIRRGLMGGFRYKRIQVTGDERYQDVPDKNKFSHPCEAAEYGAMATLETNESGRVKARPRTPAPRM
jgi:hypothetical protein